MSRKSDMSFQIPKEAGMLRNPMLREHLHIVIQKQRLSTVQEIYAGMRARNA
jgi:hypothetical protein